MRRIPKLTTSIISIVFLVLLDQVTKKLAEAYLIGKEAIPVLNDFFVLVYTTNRGGFLSFGSEVNSWMWTLFFVVMPILVIVLVSVYIIVNKRNDAFYLSFWVFLSGGGIGNIIDRILYGEVIDFMNVGIGSLRTGIFNVADLYLNVFAPLIILIYYIRRNRKEKFN